MFGFKGSKFYKMAEKLENKTGSLISVTLPYVSLAVKHIVEFKQKHAELFINDPKKALKLEESEFQTEI